MSEMRLIVAGAGGRMGRALTRAISETPGTVLAGALEAPGSELLGRDAGVLAGLQLIGITQDANKAIMLIAATDCSNMPITDSANLTITIKQGGSQYLQWAADGTVAPVNAPNPPQTTWQLANLIGGNLLIKATCNPQQQYLNGNTSSGAVNVRTAEDPNGGTTWFLTPVVPTDEV